jgi:hypothetical protein
MRPARPEFYPKEVSSDEYNDFDHYHHSVGAAVRWRRMGMEQAGEVVVVSRSGGGTA